MLKKFFTNFMIMTISVSILLFIFNYLYINSNYYNLKYNCLENNIEIAVFGTSHGKDNFKFDGMDFASYNFARPDQSFYYDLELLKQYTPNLKQECVIILPVSYHSFNLSPELSSDNVRNFEYYHILKQGYMFKDKNLLTYFNFRYFPIIASNHETILALMNKNPNTTIVDINASDMDSIIFKKNASKRAIEFSKYDNKIYNYNINILLEIIDYCEYNKLNLVLVTAPITKQINDFMDKDFIENKFSKFINDIDREVLYLDYSHDKRFEDNLNMFKNTDHLNREGVLAFAEILINDLNKFKIINNK